MIDFVSRVRCLSLAAALFVPIATASARTNIPLAARAAANADLTGTVTDSTSGQPIQSADISVVRTTGGVVGTATTDAFGRFTIHNLAPGSYSVSAHLLGFRPITRPLTIPERARRAADALCDDADRHEPRRRTGHRDRADLARHAHRRPGLQAERLSRRADQHDVADPAAIDRRRGRERRPAKCTFAASTPSTPTTSTASPCRRASPGSLNELFDPVGREPDQLPDGRMGRRVRRTERGGRQRHDQDPVGRLSRKSRAATPARSIARRPPGPTSFNGQSFSASGNNGPWGVFVSGARQLSNMRLEPRGDRPGRTARSSTSTTTAPTTSASAKLQYTPSTRDVFDLEVNLSQTKFAVPFDSTGGAFQNDHQRDMNSFVNLGWHHQFGDLTGDGTQRSDLFAGFSRAARACITIPIPTTTRSSCSFRTRRHVQPRRESQARTSSASSSDYAMHPSTRVWSSSSERCRRSRPATRTSRPSTRPAPSGPQSNVGLSTGTTSASTGRRRTRPVEWLELRTGVRYDAHNAPFAGTQSQVSPRVRLNFYPVDVDDRVRVLRPPVHADEHRGPARDHERGAGRRGCPGHAAGARQFLRGRLDSAVSRGRASSRSSRRITRRALPASTTTRCPARRSSPTSTSRTRGSPVSRACSSFDRAARLRLRERRAQPRVRVRHDHRRLLPRRPAGRRLRPRPRPAAVDRRQRDVCAGHFFLSGTAIYGSGLTNGVDPADCNCSIGTGPVRLQQGHPRRSRARSSTRAAGYTFVVGANGVSARALRRQRVQQEVPAQGRVLQRPSVGRPRSFQLRLKAAF